MKADSVQADGGTDDAPRAARSRRRTRGGRDVARETGAEPA